MSDVRVEFLPVDELTPDLSQPRKRFDNENHLTLIESIRSRGILQPIRVRRTTQGWTIIDGERRWRAAKALDLATIPVIVEEREVGEGEVVLQQLAANLARCDLNPIEKAEALRRVVALTGQAVGTVAQGVGTSAPTASKLLALLELSGADQQRVRNGSLGLAAAYRVARGASSPRASPSRMRRAKSAGARERRPHRHRLAPGIVLLVRREVAHEAIVSALVAMLNRLRSPGAPEHGESGPASGVPT